METAQNRDQHGRDGRAIHGQVLGTPNGDARAREKPIWGLRVNPPIAWRSMGWRSSNARLPRRSAGEQEPSVRPRKRKAEDENEDEDDGCRLSPAAYYLLFGTAEKSLTRANLSIARDGQDG